MTSETSSVGHQEFSRGYSRYVLALLLLVNVFSFIDRQILAAFFAAGLPGLPLALVLYLTLREPKCGASEHAASTTPFRHLAR